MASKKRGVFQTMLNRVGEVFQTNQPEDEFIDYVVNTIEPKLKQVRGYRKRLQEPLNHCREHCKALVAKIPGPIHLKQSDFHDHPVIKATFAGSGRIEEILRRADSAADQPPISGTERVALLTMTSKQKTVFGRKKQGNMMMADTAMRAITFTNHNIVGLAATLDDSKKALEKYCLEIIAEAAARELSEIRTKLVDLRQRHEWLRAMHKMFGAEQQSGMGCVFVPFDPEKAQKQQKLKQMMAETEGEIAEASRKSETPEKWLTIVEDFLSKPEDILGMQLVSLRLDWSNVLTDDPEEKADTITLGTFTLADEMQREGVLVAYDQV